jgi:DNA-binding response OmpR family regulator
VARRRDRNDYLTKPFRTEELLARIEALIRRSKGHSATVVRLGDLELDLSQRVLSRHGIEIPLTAHEFRTLTYLSLNKGRVVSQTELTGHLQRHRGDHRAAAAQDWRWLDRDPARPRISDTG